MHCLIFYFSLTGNTKRAAEQIQKGIQDSGNKCDLMEIRDFSERIGLAKYHLYGFMAPVFGFAEPSVFKAFIKNLPPLYDVHAFIGATAGGDYGNYFFNVNELLVGKGFTTVDKIGIEAPSSFTVWREEEKGREIDAAELQKAYDYGLTIIERFKDYLKDRSISLPDFPKDTKGTIASSLVGDTALRVYIGTIKIDKEKCTKCGICVDNCAWGAITMTSKKDFPKRENKQCGGCCACINLCPEGALYTFKTKGKERYKESSFTGYKGRIKKWNWNF